MTINYLLLHKLGVVDEVELHYQRFGVQGISPLTGHSSVRVKGKGRALSVDIKVKIVDKIRAYSISLEDEEFVLEGERSRRLSLFSGYKMLSRYRRALITRELIKKHLKLSTSRHHETEDQEEY